MLLSVISFGFLLATHVVTAQDCPAAGLTPLKNDGVNNYVLDMVSGILMFPYAIGQCTSIDIAPTDRWYVYNCVKKGGHWTVTKTSYTDASCSKNEELENEWSEGDSAPGNVGYFECNGQNSYAEISLGVASDCIPTTTFFVGLNGCANNAVGIDFYCDKDQVLGQIYEPSAQFTSSLTPTMPTVESTNLETSEYETSEYETSEYETSEYETSEYETSEYETSEYETSEYETSEYATSEYETSEYETSEYESSEYESSEYETSEYETSEYETSEYETSEYETSEYETSEYETSEYETSEYETSYVPQTTSLLCNAPLCAIWKFNSECQLVFNVAGTSIYGQMKACVPYSTETETTTKIFETTTKIFESTVNATSATPEQTAVIVKSAQSLVATSTLIFGVIFILLSLL